jgi:exopolyphosphatase/guanosine-5'-triphosphate,3'-diphosphate pyrophosphatase
MAALFAEVRQALAGSVPRDLQGHLIGVAGTATTLAMLQIGLSDWKREKVHGLDLTLERVRFWLAELLSMNAAQRTERLGVRAGRADVLPAGVAVLEATMTHLGRPGIVVSANGLRVGAALQRLEMPSA